MATFTVTTFINRPLQEVFDFMTSTYIASSTHVALDRDRSGTHLAHRVAVGNPCTAECPIIGSTG